MSGKVYLVGAGPGAADLITVRGVRLLAKADMVFFDALVEPEMLEYCSQAEKIAVGKRCGRYSTAQRFIEKRLIHAAQNHAVVVRLKGGDPMMFGRADEELRALEAAGIDVEVVPGITAALAAAATLKRSLTLRGVARSVAFATEAKAQADCNECPDESRAINADTLVYYMGRDGTETIARRLLDAGRAAETPVRIVESISTSRERILAISLAQMAEGVATGWLAGLSPALLLIGDALASRDELPSAVVRDGLQDGDVFADGRRVA